jgi:hypothetical protein
MAVLFSPLNRLKAVFRQISLADGFLQCNCCNYESADAQPVAI